MARLVRLPLLARLCIVDDLSEIAFMQADPRFDRVFARYGHLLNHLIIERITVYAKTSSGETLSAFRPRKDTARQAAQNDLDNADLEDRLDDRITRDMAAWLAGDEPDTSLIGPLCQSQILHVLPGAFGQGDAESWEAAVLFDTCIRSLNLPANAWRFLSGQFDAARLLLSERASDSPVAMHAISIAVQSLVKSFVHLHAALREDRAKNLSDRELATLSVTAPDSALRYLREDAPVPFAPHVIPAGTLVQLKLQKAVAGKLDLEGTFLTETWSACPGRRLVMAMLETTVVAYRRDLVS